MNFVLIRSLSLYPKPKQNNYETFRNYPFVSSIYPVCNCPLQYGKPFNQLLNQQNKIDMINFIDFMIFMIIGTLVITLIKTIFEELQNK